MCAYQYLFSSLSLWVSVTWRRDPCLLPTITKKYVFVDNNIIKNLITVAVHFYFHCTSSTINTLHLSQYLKFIKSVQIVSWTNPFMKFSSFSHQNSETATLWDCIKQYLRNNNNQRFIEARRRITELSNGSNLEIFKVHLFLRKNYGW